MKEGELLLTVPVSAAHTWELRAIESAMRIELGL
jgi:hypothetical protein